MIDLVYVGDRCNDHSPSSGYDQVCSLFPRAGWLSGRALEAGRIEWHREPSSNVEPRVFHVIYGDCSGKAVPAILRERYPRAKIISSAHQPIARLRDDAPALAALRVSDAIITVAEQQALELQALGLGLPIYPIPHGVWTRVFHPASAAEHARSGVLMVGSFLRDWDGARKVADGLARAGVRVLALGAGARKHLGVEDVGFEISPRVDEDELAQLYQRSAALFLPFLEATASNAMLEAMAAGCPIVCPRLGSLVDEYLGDDRDAFEPGHYDVAIARLLAYVRDPAACQARSRQLMTRVDAFDWSRLVELHAEVYDELAARSVPGATRSVTVPPGARMRLGRELFGFDGPIDNDAFVGRAEACVARNLPRHLLEEIDRLARGVTPTVALRLRGLPIDPELPPTPTTGTLRKPSQVSEAVIAGVAARLGELVAYRDEMDGVLVQNVFPRAEERSAPSNASSEVSLDLHTEIAFRRGEPRWVTYETSPDFLLLLCLRQAPAADAWTRLVAADTLLARMTAEERRLLEDSRFQLRAPYSFTRGGDQSRPWSEPVPLVHDGARIALDLACGVRAIGSEAQLALDALRAAAADPDLGQRFALEPGDLLVIDNRRALHGRSAFVTREDGGDRWIQRVYVRRRGSGATDQHEPAELREQQRAAIVRL